MCGICGYMHLDRSKQASGEILKDMLDTLARRGPDDNGVYLKANVALGHRRLSIIDLETGHQPMFNENGSLGIVYNGEVYNFQELKKGLEEKGHKFKTHSDTEVIIHAYEEYGEDCPKLFNGMFAFAIWDSRAQTLFLARDRFGKKPLYYALFDNQFIFASELKAILKHPSVRREIDPAALSKYLAYEYVPSPYSIFKDIKKLEAGSRLFLEGDGIRTDYYWDLTFKREHPFNLKDAEERLGRLFKEAVRRRLISDVPLGVFLSGGIDSSAVVCMMAELMDTKKIKTFSVGFGEKSFDESTDARRVADFFGTDHHEEIVKPDTMLDVLPDILDLLDEPFADSSIIPTYLVSKFTRRHVKVALGGDGGDELFLGYPSFMAHRINEYLSRWPGPIRAASSKSLALAADLLGDGYGKRFSKGLSYPDDVRHQVWIGSLTPPEQSDLFLSEGALNYDIANLYDLTKRFFRKAENLSPMDRAIYIYVKTYMTDDILTKVDRASMANSLEVRAPFLDTELAEFAVSIPPQFKLKGFKTKWILKEVLKGKLPVETLNKGKQGFAVPVAKWLKTDLKHLLLEAFDRKKIEKEGIFNYNYIKGLIDSFLANKGGSRKEIWALFMFEMWYDKWMR